MAVNPYLQGMADDISRRSNTALQQGLQGIRSNSVMNGGFGGSRQGVAEGAAISGAADSLQGNLANMYNTDYQASQNRAAQLQAAQLAAESARYSADQSLAASKYGSDMNFNVAGLNNTTALRGQDLQSQLGYAGLANQMGIAGLNNSTQRDIATMQNQLGYAGLQNQANIAGGQLGLGYAGLQNQADIAGMQNQLGYAGLANQLGIAGLNSSTQRDIANMQNQTTQRGQDQNYNLGLGGLANQRDLGMGNLALGFQNSNNSYDLGLRQNDLGYAGLDANIAQNNFNNQMAGANLGLNIYDRQQQANNLGLTAGGAIQNTPLNYWSQFSNAANSIGQGYGTQTASGGGGSPLMGALGGAQLGSKLASSWGGSGQFQPGQMGQAVADNTAWYNNQIGF